LQGKRTDDETRRLLLEEAYAAALFGRFEESRRLLAELSGAAGASLCGARLAVTRGSEAERARGREELESLLGADGDESWRAALDLARLARDEGRFADAAALLKQAIERFRLVAAEPGSARSSLASLLSAEVGALATDDGPRPASRPSEGNAGDEGRGHRQADAVPAEPDLLLRLVELGKRLASESDPDQVLRIVLHEAIELTGTERGFVVLVHGEEFAFALAENLDWSEIDQPSFEVSRTLVRGVIEQGKPLVLVLPAAAAAAPAHRSLAEIGARAVACVPVLHQGATLGVLYLDGRHAAPALRGPIERLLELLANQAGAALENARAHQAKSRALEAAEESLRRHRSESDARASYDEILGSAEVMQELYRRLDRISPTEMPVLILGETGTGKELVARSIHARGPRAACEFVATNCAGIADSLLESELFGHERGAFTGAERARPGLFELAHGGTLFLDEIGDMSLRMQADLLRVLQSGEVRRVGGRETFHVDVRVVAATHRDLEELQRRGEFRQDLFYRLNVLTVALPPLRERMEDVPLLAQAFARRYAPAEREAPRFSDRAMKRLVVYPWPGNVRELENIVRRMCVLDVPLLEERHLPPEVLQPRSGPTRAGSLQRAEEEAVRRALSAAKGNKAEAARILGVDRKTLYAKLRRLASDAGGRSD
jgi:transcriptional regulator with GAF, ATPase, and Fis domain